MLRHLQFHIGEFPNRATQNTRPAPFRAAFRAPFESAKMARKVVFRIMLMFLLVFWGVGQIHSQDQSTRQSLVLCYKKTDTTELKLHVFFPPEDERPDRFPAIIFFFGGGWINGSIKHFEKQAKYLASRGMVGVLADYRTYSRFGTTPFEAVRDAKSAIRFLKANAKSLRIDSARIVAAGGSAGGHLAAAADLTELDEPYEDLSVSSRPHAVVMFNPVFDNGPGGYGYDRIGQRYLAISPMHNIKSGAAPAVAFFGAKDQHVPVETAALYKKKMEEAGNRFELFIYPDQAHGFFNSGRYFLETLKQADIFLESLGYIKGKPQVDAFEF